MPSLVKFVPIFSFRVQIWQSERNANVLKNVIVIVILNIFYTITLCQLLSLTENKKKRSKTIKKRTFEDMLSIT